MVTVVLVTFVTSRLNLMDSESTLYTDIVLTLLVLAVINIFGSSCRMVALQIHSNHCIGDLCYIKVELNDSGRLTVLYSLTLSSLF